MRKIIKLTIMPFMLLSLTGHMRAAEGATSRVFINSEDVVQSLSRFSRNFSGVSALVLAGWLNYWAANQENLTYKYAVPGCTILAGLVGGMYCFNHSPKEEVANIPVTNTLDNILGVQHHASFVQDKNDTNVQHPQYALTKEQVQNAMKQASLWQNQRDSHDHVYAVSAGLSAGALFGAAAGYYAKNRLMES